MASKTQNEQDTPVVATEETEATEAKVSKKQAQKEARVMDPDVAAWVASHARPAVSLCLCGCGGETKGRFVPGHDATLKERLRATVELADGKAKTDAEAALATFGW